MSEVASILHRLATVAHQVPLLESSYELLEPELGPPCCAGELAELRQQFKGDRGLPEDYLEFLGQCRRIVAMDVHVGYALYSPLELFRCGGGAPSFIQVPELKIFEEVFVLAIGGDGGGNQFLMGTSSCARGFVWKWDHEHPPRADGMGSDGLLLVARSFGGFLERVAADWEAFARGDDGWRYLAG